MSENLIINGDFRVAQRSPTLNLAAGQSGYSCDRWKVLSNNVTVVAAQEIEPALSPLANGSSQALAIYATGTGSVSFGQQIEYADFSQINGGHATLSMWLQSTRTQASPSVQVILRCHTSTIDLPVLFTYSAYQLGTIAISSTLAQYTFPIPVNVGPGMTSMSVEFVMNVDASMSYNNSLKISQVQLKPGTALTAFEHESISETLMKCQRFYEKSYDLATAPGTPNIEAASIRSSAYDHSYMCDTTLKFKTRKRIAPIVTVYSPNTGAAGFIADNWATDVPVNQANFGESGGLLYNSAGLWNPGHWMEYHYTADADF